MSAWQCVVSMTGLLAVRCGEQVLVLQRTSLNAPGYTCCAEPSINWCSRLASLCHGAMRLGYNEEIFIDRKLCRLCTEQRLVAFKRLSPGTPFRASLEFFLGKIHPPGATASNSGSAVSQADSVNLCVAFASKLEIETKHVLRQLPSFENARTI